VIDHAIEDFDQDHLVVMQDYPDLHINVRVYDHRMVILDINV